MALDLIISWRQTAPLRLFLAALACLILSIACGYEHGFAAEEPPAADHGDDKRGEPTDASGSLNRLIAAA
jgi:hypothetical protein